MNATSVPADSLKVCHATVVTRRQDRRIRGQVGERRNLCGAAATDHDFLARESQRVEAMPGWVLCSVCLCLSSEARQ